MLLKIEYLMGTVFWTYEGRRYCTTHHGEGAFELLPSGERCRQVLGTTQLCLRGVSQPTIRRRILRAMGYSKQED